MHNRLASNISHLVIDYATSTPTAQMELLFAEIDELSTIFNSFRLQQIISKNNIITKLWKTELSPKDKILSLILTTCQSSREVRAIKKSIKMNLSKAKIYKEFYITHAKDFDQESLSQIEIELHKQAAAVKIIYEINETLISGFTIREYNSLLNFSLNDRIDNLKFFLKNYEHCI